MSIDRAVDSQEGYAAEHFLWRVEDGVGFVTLNRPERKNPLSFESYAELRDLFRSLAYTDRVRSVVISGARGEYRDTVVNAYAGPGRVVLHTAKHGAVRVTLSRQGLDVRTWRGRGAP